MHAALQHVCEMYNMSCVPGSRARKQKQTHKHKHERKKSGRAEAWALARATQEKRIRYNMCANNSQTLPAEKNGFPMQILFPGSCRLQGTRYNGMYLAS